MDKMVKFYLLFSLQMASTSSRVEARDTLQAQKSNRNWKMLILLSFQKWEPQYQGLLLLWNVLLKCSASRCCKRAIWCFLRHTWPPTTIAKMELKRSIDYDANSQLELYCKEEEKWSKLPHVQTFFELNFVCYSLQGSRCLKGLRC